MAKLPRYPTDYKPTGDDLNNILAIIDSGFGTKDAFSNRTTGDSLNPNIPNPGGSFNPGAGGVSSLSTPRGLTGAYGIDNFAQTHTAYVLLSWTPNPVTDFVARYDIYYHKGSDPTVYTLSVGGDITSTRINNLFPGNTYSFAIQAHDAASRASSWCPEITIAISLDSDAPAVPTGLTATSATKGIFLNWTEVGNEGISDDLKQHRIAISTDGGVTFPNVQTVGPGNSWFYSYTPTNPSTAQQIVYFKIATADWTGNISDYSAPVSAVVGGIDPNELVSGTLVGPITITNALQVNSTIVSLARITGASLQTGQNLIMTATNPSIVAGTNSLRLMDHANVNANLTVPDNGQAVFRNGIALLGGSVDVGAGVLGYTQVTADQSGITTIADLTNLNAVVTVGTGRRIRITGYANVLSDTADSSITMYIQESSTKLGVAIRTFRVVSRPDTVIAQVILTPTGGSHTYKLTGTASGSASLTLKADTSTYMPAFILVEDLGT